MKTETKKGASCAIIPRRHLSYSQGFHRKPRAFQNSGSFLFVRPENRCSLKKTTAGSAVVDSHKSVTASLAGSGFERVTANVVRIASIS